MTALLMTCSAAQAYNYSWTGAGADAGSFASFDVSGFDQTSVNYSTLEAVNGTGFTPQTGFFTITEVIVPTDRFGMLHPSTGIGEGLIIDVPGTQNVSYVHGGIDLFLQPGVIRFPDASPGSFGTYQTYGSFLLVPGHNPYSGEYAVDPTTKNGLLTITQDSLPEPATWALIITGFGLVGAAARRRRVMPLNITQSSA